MPADKRNRFILDRPTGRTLRARDALICVFVAVILLLVIEGRRSATPARRWTPACSARSCSPSGIRPAGSPITSRSPTSPTTSPHRCRPTTTCPAARRLQLRAGRRRAGAGRRCGAGAAAPITTDAFDPAALGAAPVKLPTLKTLLVTGDSLVQPLDVQLGRKLAGEGVVTKRDAHLGTGISKTDIVDWGLLSTQAGQG